MRLTDGELDVMSRGPMPIAVVVIGGANLDIKARSLAPVTPRTSNPGHGSMSPGGVGRNVAENLARLGTPTHLVAAVGADRAGERLVAETAAAGVHLDHLHRDDERPTGTYTAVIDADGELVVAVSDMAVTDALRAEHLDVARHLIARAALVVLDGNLAPPVLDHALDLAHQAGVRCLLEPVSVPKATRLAALVRADRPVFALTPNRDELQALSGAPAGSGHQLLDAVAALHARGIRHVWVRLGADGSLFSTAGEGHERLLAPQVPVVDVTGAGDAMLAGFAHALVGGQDPLAAARFGHAVAAATVGSPHTVRPDLSVRLVDELGTGPGTERSHR